MYVDGTKVKRRKLSVFDLPKIDPPVFIHQKRRSSVHLGSNSDIKPLQIGRLTSYIQLQEWDRYGWHQSMECRNKSQNKSIFITRNDTYVDGDRRYHRSSTSILPSQIIEPLPTSLSLPAIPTNGRGDPMLRCPTFIPAKPVSETDDVFIMLCKGKKLKPFSFSGDDAKAHEFYRTHYPLLLGNILEHGDINTTVKKVVTEKQVRERLRQNTAELRRIKVRQRIRDADKQLLELESCPDGVGMVTELRDDVFYPVLLSCDQNN